MMEWLTARFDLIPTEQLPTLIVVMAMAVSSASLVVVALMAAVARGIWRG